MYRRILLVILTVFLSATLFTGQAWAFQTITKDTVYVGPGKMLSGPYLLTGQTVRMDGTIDGDVLVMAQTVSINGLVKGDLMVVADNAQVNGRVEGGIRLAAREATIDSTVRGSFIGAAESLYIDRGGVIGRDLVFAATRFILDGEVGRYVSAAGKDIYLNGKIGDDMRLVQAEKLKLGEKAHIKGNLAYSSPRKAAIEEGTVVEGHQEWHKVKGAKDFRYTRYFNVVVGFLGLLLVWWVFRLVVPTVWETAAHKITMRPWRTLVLGGAAFLMVPFLVLVLLFTSIGAPLGLMLAAAYVTTVYLSKVIAATALGEFIGRVTGWRQTMHSFWLYLLGLSLVFLLIRIPQVGWAFSLLVVWWGMGAVCLIPLARPAEDKE